MLIKIPSRTILNKIWNIPTIIEKDFDFKDGDIINLNSLFINNKDKNNDQDIDANTDKTAEKSEKEIRVYDHKFSLVSGEIQVFIEKVTSNHLVENNDNEVLRLAKDYLCAVLWRKEIARVRNSDKQDELNKSIPLLPLVFKVSGSYYRLLYVTTSSCVVNVQEVDFDENKEQVLEERVIEQRDTLKSNVRELSKQEIISKNLEYYSRNNFGDRYLKSLHLLKNLIEHSSILNNSKQKNYLNEILLLEEPNSDLIKDLWQQVITLVISEEELEFNVHKESIAYNSELTKAELHNQLTKISHLASSEVVDEISIDDFNKRKHENLDQQNIGYSKVSLNQRILHKVILQLSLYYDLRLASGWEQLATKIFIKNDLKLSQNFGCRVRLVKINANSFYEQRPIMGFVLDDSFKSFDAQNAIGPKTKRSQFLSAVRDGLLLPVIIYFKSSSAYYVHPKTQQTIYLDSNNINTISNFCYVLNELLVEDKNLFKFLFFRLLSVCKKEIVIVSGVFVISIVLGILFPYVCWYIPAKVVPFGDYNMLLSLAVISVVSICAKLCFDIVPHLALMNKQNDVLQNFIIGIFDRFLKLKVSSILEKNAGELTLNLLCSVGMYNNAQTIIAQHIFGFGFWFISSLLMIIISPVLGGFWITLIVLASILEWILFKKYLEVYVSLGQERARHLGGLKQYIEAIDKIKYTNSSERIINKIFSSVSDEFGISQRLFYYKRYQIYLLIVFLAIGLSGTIILVSNGYLTLNDPHALLISELSAFIVSCVIALLSAIGMGSLVMEMVKLYANSVRVNELVFNEEYEKNTNNNDFVITGKVVLKEATFKYGNALDKVLDRVSLEVKPKEFVAIIGPSGSGKSSFLNVLLGFNELSSGVVYYSDIDLNFLNKNFLRRQIGVVRQQSKIIAGTILDNLCIGTNFGEKEALQALDLVGFKDNVMSLPMGLHTFVSPETVSGGEQQRLLLARALIGSPKILLLDEATSALDNRNQEIISNNLSKLNITRIVIAHRLSTIRNADSIYWLENGNLTLLGNFAEMSSSEFYKKRVAEALQE